MTLQGNLALLNDPLAQELLHSTNLARLAYTWNDGTPRLAPICFHWNGEEVVLGTPPNSPKVRALPKNPSVVLVIDDDGWPYKVLQIRGVARLETLDGIVPEYAAAIKRYFGEEQGQAWLDQIGSMFSQMVRIRIRPEWVSLFDFEKRFPSSIQSAMSG